MDVFRQVCLTKYLEYNILPVNHVDLTRYNTARVQLTLIIPPSYIPPYVVLILVYIVRVFVMLFGRFARSSYQVLVCMQLAARS